jgi:hypothetical protein
MVRQVPSLIGRNFSTIVTAAGFAVCLIAVHPCSAADPAPAPPALTTSTASTAMTFAQDKQFLGQHTKVIELTDGAARLAVCPEYQGRVMTSSCEADAGRSFGWIHKSFITAGKPDARFNNYGGEDRLWLAPEGGQFSLWFAPGAKQNLDNWYTPPGLNDGAFDVLPSKDATTCHMQREIKLTNASNTVFQLGVDRQIRLMSLDDFGKIFGPAPQRLIADSQLKMVGFESINQITNRGPAMKKATGLTSIWSMGQFPPGDQTVIIVPYRPSTDATFGSIVKADYFGQVPADRLKQVAGAVLFLADGKYRSKIGTSQKRVMPIAASVDFQNNVLTLISFDLPSHPENRLYLNNAWDLPQKDPFTGDVFNSYNDGPPAPGKPPLGPFYELESLSPAQELATGQSLTHRQRTFHIQASYDDLALIVRATMGINLSEVRGAMFPTVK